MLKQVQDDYWLKQMLYWLFNQFNLVTVLPRNVIMIWHGVHKINRRKDTETPKRNLWLLSIELLFTWTSLIHIHLLFRNSPKGNLWLRSIEHTLFALTINDLLFTRINPIHCLAYYSTHHPSFSCQSSGTQQRYRRHHRLRS